jgi:hypothetical protein
MGIARDFYVMMPHTVTVFGTSTMDKYGKQAWSGAGTNYRCRLVFDSRMVRDAEGREILEEGRAIVYGVATVTVKDRLTLPGGRSPLVTSVATIKDETGDHHTVIGFGA